MNLDSNDEDSTQSEVMSNNGDDADVFLKHFRVPKLLNNGPYGLNKSFRTRGYGAQVKLNNDGTLMSLTELAAQKVACHLPFGLVEHYEPPVPESLQCRITYWSFPQDEEDIKLYTCLANGNADFFYRAEDLISQNAVRDMVQVGFHLSADVRYMTENEVLETFDVALTFDRRRLTTCDCSCMTAASWCQHAVAVCLQRIRRPNEVKLRAPVSESLRRLEKDQLQKFALYLINELPQQILPAAQRLIDELLSGTEADINQNPALPDPTAGATIDEQTNWCLDYERLSSDIHNILTKHCTTQPTVCSDIQSLHVTAPPATTEYSQLLRPIRGREPEGIWNLISIVGELMKRRDPNLFKLLEIMTEEVMKLDKIVTWWFETKVSLHSGSSVHFTQSKSSQSTSQYSCSNFCDEIVHLWRLAALNPSASQAERQELERKLSDWHLAILKKHSSISESYSAKVNKRNPLELFPGFRSALEGCRIDWSDWDERQATLVTISEHEKTEKEKPTKTPKRRRRKSKASRLNAANGSLVSEPSLERNDHEDPSSSNVENQDPDVGCSGSLGESLVDDSEEKNEQERSSSRGSRLEPLLEIEDNRGQAREQPNEDINEYEDDLQVYFMDGQPESPRSDSLDDMIKRLVNLKRLADPLEVLYAKVEGLYANGHLDEARLMARRLAVEILSQENYPTLKQLYVPIRRRKKKGSLDNQMSIVASETLTKLNFLSNVLIDDSENHCLIFRLVLFGINLKRAPAATKPLEVKLISQKQDLVMLLKNIVLQEGELNILRRQAECICEMESQEYQPDALTLSILGNYILEALVLTRHPRLTTDANLGFQTALVALGAKTNISETDHPLLCEGIRRQRGELALSLITYHKDDQDKLELILKQLLDKDLLDSSETCDKSPTSIKKNSAQQDSNHPTEAAAHFMYELAKTVFDKAGGNSTTAHLFRPQVAAPGGRGIHRKLHMCSLRIALYALGLHNRTSPNWMQRTYNGRASFIHEQALEIGLPAIKYLSDNWQGFLSPVEAASIADKAGCSSDLETRRIAAELAKSCLKYANFLDYNAVSRILAQCIEQTTHMAVDACKEVEDLAKNDSFGADLLFAASRAWYDLYLKLCTDEQQCPGENSYQLNNLSTIGQQDNGAGDWLATSGQSHLNDGQSTPLNNVRLLPVWEEGGEMESDKHKDCVETAFQVGLKALESLRSSTHFGTKHNPKKLDEILWLFGISKSLGLKWISAFSKSVMDNIADPYILHVITIDFMGFLDSIKVPENHIYRTDVLMPICQKCLNSCMEQTLELTKHHTYDQKSCIETILDIVQTMTVYTRSILTAQYYWEILKFLELHKKNEVTRLDKRGNARRSRYCSIVVDRLKWLNGFSVTNLGLKCPCEECWLLRGDVERFRLLRSGYQKPEQKSFRHK